MSINFAGVWAIWRRHFHVYKKTFLYNCLPPISEPVVYLLAFGYGLSPLIREIKYEGVPVDYIRFFAPGMMAVGVLFQSFFEGGYGTFVRFTYQRTWNAMLTSPLTLKEIFLGDLLWAATKGAIGGAITGIVAILWGAMSLVEFFISIPIIVLGGLVFAALGMTAAGLAKRIDFLNLPVFLFVIPMFAICGTYFPRDNLPEVMKVPVAALPLSALVDLMRGYIHKPHSILLSLASLLLWGGLFCWLGWRGLYKKIYR